MKNEFTNIFTIGFAETSAPDFFELLRRVGVQRIIDIRLHPNSQLSGFAKQDHLAYFLKKIVGAEYVHLPILAPTPALFNAYKRANGSWDEYSTAFLRLMEERRIELELDPSLFKDGCLLCSENQPHHCHRRLVAEYLRGKWENVEISHLA